MILYAGTIILGLAGLGWAFKELGGLAENESITKLLNNTTNIVYILIALAIYKEVEK